MNEPMSEEEKDKMVEPYYEDEGDEEFPDYFDQNEEAPAGLEERLKNKPPQRWRVWKTDFELYIVIQ